MSKLILNRRAFIKTAATTAAVVAVVGGMTTILAANRAWAMSLSVLSPHEAEVLLKMTRHLYPHDWLGDIYYASVVEDLDNKLAKEAAHAEICRDGIATLDDVFKVPWLALSDGAQVEAMKRIEDGDFFKLVRGHTVVSLYNNETVWTNFGYEGASAHLGGYLYRGFQDAGWTMQPDEEASQPAFTG